MDPSQIPSGTPPDGIVPNLVNPHSIGYIPRIGIYVFSPLMLVFIALRIGTRLRQARALGLDDITCILAAACTLAFCGIIMPYLGNPLGRHQWDVPMSDVTDRFLLAALLSLGFSNLGIMFIKTSLLIFYLHVFKPVTWARIAIWSGLIAVLIFYITCDAVLLGFCISRSGRTWMGLTITGSCVEVEVKTALAAGWFGTLIDFYVLAIPIRLISGLMLNKRRKIGVLAIFMTGLFACAASAAGLAQRYQLVYTDMTYDDSLFYLFAIIEVNIAIICSCMPIITAPLKVIVLKLASSWSYLKKQHQALHSHAESRRDQAKSLSADIPGAKISGLRTFVQKFQRSMSRNTSVVMDMSSSSTLGSLDGDYHRQLRDVYKNNSASALGPSFPGSQRQGAYREV